MFLLNLLGKFEGGRAVCCTAPFCRRFIKIGEIKISTAQVDKLDRIFEGYILIITIE
jgi:hypothetical protein